MSKNDFLLTKPALPAVDRAHRKSRELAIIQMGGIGQDDAAKTDRLFRYFNSNRTIRNTAQLYSPWTAEAKACINTYVNSPVDSPLASHDGLPKNFWQVGRGICHEQSNL